VELTRDILSEDGRWLAMKGKFPDQEIAELPSDIEVEKKLLLTLGNGKIERVLIVLKRKNAQ
jgi:16S rRNA (guanine527-N7)-methyltransferase